MSCKIAPEAALFHPRWFVALHRLERERLANGGKLLSAEERKSFVDSFVRANYREADNEICCDACTEGQAEALMSGVDFWGNPKEFLDALRTSPVKGIQAVRPR